MQPIVVANVSISEAEYVALSMRLHRRRRWFTFGLTVAILAYLLWSSGELDDPTLLLVNAGMLIFIFSMSWWLTKRRFRKKYLEARTLQQSVTYTLSAIGISTKSPITQGITKWSSVQAVQQQGPWFLITTSPNVYIPLDSRCVQEPHSATDLAVALTQRGATLSATQPLDSEPDPNTADPAIFILNVHPTVAQYTWLSLLLTIKTKPSILILIIPVGTALVTLGQLLFGQTTFMAMWQENSSQLVMMLFFLSVPFLMIWATRKQYSSSPQLQHPVNYTLTPDKMYVESAAINAEISWEGIQVAHQFGRWVFLHTTTNIGYILDMNQIAPPNTKTDVYALWQAKGITVK